VVVAEVDPGYRPVEVVVAAANIVEMCQAEVHRLLFLFLFLLRAH